MLRAVERDWKFRANAEYAVAREMTRAFLAPRDIGIALSKDAY